MAGSSEEERLQRNMGFPFLKKSPLRLSKDGAECTLRLIAALDGEMGDAIRTEAADIHAAMAASRSRS